MRRGGRLCRHDRTLGSNWPGIQPDSSELQIYNKAQPQLKTCRYEFIRTNQESYLTLALSTPIPKLMVATITSTFPCIQSFCASVRSPAFKPATAQVYFKVRVTSDPQNTENPHTCVIWFGRDTKLGQLVGHSFTAFSGPTVDDPAALFTHTNVHPPQYKIMV